MSDSRVALTVGLAKVLHQLGVDDAFRDEFQRDPQGVLARHGVELPAGDLTVHLPSKEELLKGFPDYLESALRDVASQMAFGPKSSGH